MKGTLLQPEVYRRSSYTVKIGRDKPDQVAHQGVKPGERARTAVVNLQAAN